MAIYVKNGIEFDVMESLSCAVHNLFKCISIKVCASRIKSIIVTCIYRQANSKIEACIDIIESFFNNNKSDIYICGDFNINLLNYYHHHNTKYFLDSFIMLNLYPCINQPTRITTATATPIDNILTSITVINSIFYISRCGIIIIVVIFKCYFSGEIIAP